MIQQTRSAINILVCNTGCFLSQRMEFPIRDIEIKLADLKRDAMQNIFSRLHVEYNLFFNKQSKNIYIR